MGQDNHSKPKICDLLPAALLLLILLFIRVHNILEMPIFVDESLHILRGRVVWDFSDIGESLLPKKLLFYYWIGLFGLNGSDSAWIARTASALLALPGGTLTYALARTIFDRRAGLVALALYTFTPMLVFFERMALADPMAATFGTGLAVISLKNARRPSARRGIMIGVLAGLAILAKLTALPFVGLPLLAIWLYGQRGVSYRRSLIVAAAVCLLVLAPSLIYVTAKVVTGTTDRVVVEQELYTTDNRPTQIVDNLKRTTESIRFLLSPWLVGLVGLSAAILILRRRARAVIYLLGAALLPWGVILLVSAQMTTRYLVLGVPPLLVLVAGGIAAKRGEGKIGLTPPMQSIGPPHAERGGRSKQRPYGILLIAIWIGLIGGPFVWRAMTNPADLRLPARDEYEYLTSTASGYGLRDLAGDLPHLPPDAAGRIVVIGLLPSCHSLPLYWTKPNAVDLKCPLFKWDTRRKQELADQIMGWADSESVVYLALDQIGDLVNLNDLPLDYQLLAVYPRPHGGDSIRLYRVLRKETSHD